MIISQDNKIENLLGSRAKIKILRTLAVNNELSITQIIKNTRLNHSSVMAHLNHLKLLNLVQEKNFGRIRIFRYKNENLKARSLKKFIEIWEGEY
ncbi:MAG: ArsR family transcriptional regulator [Candidatus Lokiarchaeota archaeon]|nr:ArsR family transcriptional regulator [Candidatus Lokiarchaeota archaeon]